MRLHKDLERVLLTEERLAERVRELGKQLSADYNGLNPLVVGVLKGSFVFIADLLRAMDCDAEVDFMVVSAYGSKSYTSGQVQILKDLNRDIEGREILVVEDILDSGVTLNYLMKVLIQRKPRSVRLCTLLDKPERRRLPITSQYTGFSVPDEFVVGYGLDYNEMYRNLPYIGVLKREIYSNE